MTTIVILAAFVIVASATPIQDTASGIHENHPADEVAPTSEDVLIEPGYNHTINHPPTGTVEPPPDVSPREPVDDDGLHPPNVDLKPPPTLEEPTGPPSDEDPFDCNITHPEGHIYLNCSFICQGDEAQVVPNGKPCSLYHVELHAEDVQSTGSNQNITGVCENGECVAKITSQSSTTSTTTTERVTENTPSSTTPNPSPTAESSNTESPESPDQPIVDGEIPSQTPQSPPGNSPVGIP